MTLPRRTLSLVVLAAVSACSLGDDPTLPDPHTIGLSATPSDSVAVGDTVQLLVTRSPGVGGPVAFTVHSTPSSGVVTVDSLGRVVGVGVGPSIVTATIGHRTAQALIVVRPALRLAPRDFTLNAGLAQAMTAEVVGLPAGADAGVRWSSSDTTIATVDAAGVVTARRMGIVQVTARSVARPDAARSVRVTVVEHPILSISVTPSSVSLAAGATLQLAAVLRDEAATSSDVTYASSDTRVATVSPTGLVSALNPGAATITVAARRDPTFATTAAVTVTEPRRGPQLSIVSVTRPDGTAIDPDSVSGEIVVELRVWRVDGAPRTVRLSLGGVDSLAPPVLLPATTATETVGTAIFRVNTAARDAAGVRRVPNGGQRLRMTVYDGASASPLAAIERWLTIANPGA